MASELTVSVVRDRSDLMPLVAQWLELSQRALELSPYYRPAPLLRRLRLRRGRQELRYVLVWDNERLAALFPFRGPALYRGLPVVALTLEHDEDQRLCTPLVRDDCARECFHALLDWFRDDGEGASLLELRALPAQGAVYRAFADVARERNQVVLSTQSDAWSDGSSVTLLVSEGAWGELAMSTLPLLRWAKRGVTSALYGAGPIRQ